MRHFVMELIQPPLVRRERRWKELQRDLMIEAQVVDQTYLAHPATSERPDDAVASGEEISGLIVWCAESEGSDGRVS
jgi:hypothetical protein